MTVLLDWRRKIGDWWSPTPLALAMNILTADWPNQTLSRDWLQFGSEHSDNVDKGLFLLLFSCRNLGFFHPSTLFILIFHPLPHLNRAGFSYTLLLELSRPFVFHRSHITTFFLRAGRVSIPTNLLHQTVEGAIAEARLRHQEDYIRATHICISRVSTSRLSDRASALSPISVDIFTRP